MYKTNKFLSRRNSTIRTTIEVYYIKISIERFEMSNWKFSSEADQALRDFQLKYEQLQFESRESSAK